MEKEVEEMKEKVMELANENQKKIEKISAMLPKKLLKTKYILHPSAAQQAPNQRNNYNNIINNNNNNNGNSNSSYYYNSNMQISYTVKTEEIKLSDVIDRWRIPEEGEKPEDPDPDQLLYGRNKELMNMSCSTFTDLIRLNSQYKVAKNYLTLLRESASLYYGQIFLQNMQIVGRYLDLLWDHLNPPAYPESLLQTKLTHINFLLTNLLRDDLPLSSLSLPTAGGSSSVYNTDLIANYRALQNPNNNHGCLRDHSSHFNSSLQLGNHNIVVTSPEVMGKIESEILESMDLRRELKRMFPPSSKISKFRLIYSRVDADRDSFLKSTNGLTNILILVRSTSNFVFGAFLHDPSDPYQISAVPPFDQSAKNDSFYNSFVEENFLFTLGGKKSLRPVKLLRNRLFSPNNRLQMMRGDGRVEMEQLDSIIGPDLDLFSSFPSCKPTYFTVLAPGYKAAINDSLLAGFSFFSPSLIEVFHCS